MSAAERVASDLYGTVMSAGALATANLADPLYLVKPWLPSGGIGVLHGPGEAGKSQLALTLALDISAGQRFLGVYETLQGTVVYIQADMTPHVAKDRLGRLESAGVSLAGRPLHLVLFPGSYDCMNELARGALWIAQLRDLAPRLVIVDSLRKSHYLDENSSNAPVEVYGAWREIVGPQPTLLFVHHDRKVNRMFDGDDTEAWRGSRAWIDEVDTGLHLTRSSKSDIRRLDWSKLRTCTEEMAGGSLSLQLDEASLLAHLSSPVEAAVVEAMRRGVPKARIVQMAMDGARWGGAAMSRPTLYRKLKHYQAPGDKDDAE